MFMHVPLNKLLSSFCIFIKPDVIVMLVEGTASVISINVQTFKMQTTA
jgi:hypothetical protein